MKKIFILLSLIIIPVFALALKVQAVKPPDTARQSAPVLPSQDHAVVSIPQKAVSVTPNTVFLGNAVVNGEIVQGYAFLHFKDAPAKPGVTCGDNVCGPGENAVKCPSDCGGGTTTDTSSCYGFIAKGASWKTVEPYLINPDNTQGLSPSYITANFDSDISTWESAAGSNLVSGGANTSQPLSADLSNPDNQNEVYFGSVEKANVIAVTVVWGIFGGPPQNRRLVEWDMVFDQVDFSWGIAQADKMDFANIATHELGHTLGLADLYTSTCNQQTMFGYASEGEINKITLEDGDIAGIRALYP